LVDNEAQGGSSLIEVSTEIRQKITDTYGFVVFLDGGNIFDEKIPDFSLPIRWAAGFGLRYFTSFGPLRFDVGMPIRKREGIDDSYQIYISIGQSY
ncbi:MAG: BamA/TamA family outer membrane protein, partial [Candidatus Berkiella sp.]